MKSFIDNIIKNKKKKKTYCNPKTMGVSIDKNEYYEIILSNSAHPEKIERTDSWQSSLFTIVLKYIENHIRACGGMVDTLVLGTSAKAWEFESLHAHHI